MLTGLIIAGLIIYIIHLGSRIGKIEKMLEGKTSTVQAPQSSAPANFNSPIAPVPNVKPMVPVVPVSSTSAQSTSLDSKGFINALPKIGVLALLFGLAFFLKYAIDQGWVSISLRLALGGAVGALFLILYYLWREKYEKYAMALAGGGLAIWYLTTFAAVRMYDVISVDGGIVILCIVTIVGLLLAHKTKSSVLSSMAWGGAFLSPILLSMGSESYTLLLIYLTVVTVALLISIFYNKTRSLFVLIMVGTGLNLLVASMSNYGVQDYYLHTLLFLIIHLAANTVAVSAIILSTGPTATESDKTEFGMLTAMLYLIFGIPLTIISYYHYRDYVSLIMLGLGAWTFILYALHDRLEFKKLNFILSGLGSLTFCLAVVWYFTGNAQAIMFYVLGLVGIIIGSMQKRFELRTWGLAIVLMGIISASLIPYAGNHTFLFTEKFGIEFLGLVALGVSYFLYKEDSLTEFEHDVHRGLLYVMAGLLWFFVSWDLVNLYSTYEQINQRNLSLSMWWLIFAVILLAGSAIQALKPLRKIALLLFGLVIVKVFLYDVQSLDTLYRIISFISLGVILLIVSFVYQHNKEKIKQYLE